MLVVGCKLPGQLFCVGADGLSKPVCPCAIEQALASQIIETLPLEYRGNDAVSQLFHGTYALDIHPNGRTDVQVFIGFASSETAPNC